MPVFCYCSFIFNDVLSYDVTKIVKTEQNAKEISIYFHFRGASIATPHSLRIFTEGKR